MADRIELSPVVIDEETCAALDAGAEGERAEIVRWLRAQATCGCAGKYGRCVEDDAPLAFADAIERGDHTWEHSNDQPS